MEKHKGALSELRACAWLLDQGYEVFRNVSDHGLVDIVALKNGKTFYFDVKGSPNGGEKSLSSEQEYAGILPLYVNASDCWIGEEPRYPPYVPDYLLDDGLAASCSTREVEKITRESCRMKR